MQKKQSTNGGHTDQKKIPPFLTANQEGSWVGPKSARAAHKLNFKFGAARVKVGTSKQFVEFTQNTKFSESFDGFEVGRFYLARFMNNQETPIWAKIAIKSRSFSLK